MSQNQKKLFSKIELSIEFNYDKSKVDDLKNLSRNNQNDAVVDTDDKSKVDDLKNLRESLEDTFRYLSVVLYTNPSESFFEQIYEFIDQLTLAFLAYSSGKPEINLDLEIKSNSNNASNNKTLHFSNIPPDKTSSESTGETVKITTVKITIKRYNSGWDFETNIKDFDFFESEGPGRRLVEDFFENLENKYIKGINTEFNGFYTIYDDKIAENYKNLQAQNNNNESIIREIINRCNYILGLEEPKETRLFDAIENLENELSEELNLKPSNIWTLVYFSSQNGSKVSEANGFYKYIITKSKDDKIKKSFEQENGENDPLKFFKENFIHPNEVGISGYVSRTHHAEFVEDFSNDPRIKAYKEQKEEKNNNKWFNENNFHKNWTNAENNLFGEFENYIILPIIFGNTFWGIVLLFRESDNSSEISFYEFAKRSTRIFRKHLSKFSNLVIEDTTDYLLGRFFEFPKEKKSSLDEIEEKTKALPFLPLIRVETQTNNTQDKKENLIDEYEKLTIEIPKNFPLPIQVFVKKHNQGLAFVESFKKHFEVTLNIFQTFFNEFVHLAELAIITHSFAHDIGSHFLAHLADLYRNKSIDVPQKSASEGDASNKNQGSLLPLGDVFGYLHQKSGFWASFTSLAFTRSFGSFTKFEVIKEALERAKNCCYNYLLYSELQGQAKIKFNFGDFKNLKDYYIFFPFGQSFGLNSLLTIVESIIRNLKHKVSGKENSEIEIRLEFEISQDGSKIFLKISDGLSYTMEDYNKINTLFQSPFYDEWGHPTFGGISQIKICSKYLTAERTSESRNNKQNIEVVYENEKIMYKFELIPGKFLASDEELKKGVISKFLVVDNSDKGETKSPKKIRLISIGKKSEEPNESVYLSWLKNKFSIEKITLKTSTDGSQNVVLVLTINKSQQNNNKESCFLFIHNSNRYKLGNCKVIRYATTTQPGSDIETLKEILKKSNDPIEIESINNNIPINIINLLQMIEALVVKVCIYDERLYNKINEIKVEKNNNFLIDEMNKNFDISFYNNFDTIKEKNDFFKAYNNYDILIIHTFLLEKNFNNDISELSSKFKFVFLTSGRGVPDNIKSLINENNNFYFIPVYDLTYIFDSFIGELSNVNKNYNYQILRFKMALVDYLLDK